MRRIKFHYDLRLALTWLMVSVVHNARQVAFGRICGSNIVAAIRHKQKRRITWKNSNHSRRDASDAEHPTLRMDVVEETPICTRLNTGAGSFRVSRCLLMGLVSLMCAVHNINVGSATFLFFWFSQMELTPSEIGRRRRENQLNDESACNGGDGASGRTCEIPGDEVPHI